VAPFANHESSPRRRSSGFGVCVVVSRFAARNSICLGGPEGSAAATSKALGGEQGRGRFTLVRSRFLPAARRRAGAKGDSTLAARVLCRSLAVQELRSASSSRLGGVVCSGSAGSPPFGLRRFNCSGGKRARRAWRLTFDCTRTKNNGVAVCETGASASRLTVLICAWPALQARPWRSAHRLVKSAARIRRAGGS